MPAPSWKTGVALALVLAGAPLAHAGERPNLPRTAPAAEAAPAAAPAPVAAPAVAVKPAEAKPAMAVAPAAAPATAVPAAAAAKKDGDKPLPYGGFAADFSLSEASTLNTLNYSNGLSFVLEPSWAVGSKYLKGSPFEHLSVSARVTLTDWLASYDPSTVTPDSDQGFAPRCSDLTTNSTGEVDPTSVQRCPTSANHRWLFDDTWLVVTDPGLYKIPGTGISVTPSVKLILPTSLTSQFATLRLTTAASVGLSRKVWDDQLKLGFTFGMSKNFHGSTAPELNAEAAPGANGAVTANYQLTDVTSDSADFYLDPSRDTTGGLNHSWAMNEIFAVEYAPKQVKKLSFSALYVLGHSFSYDADQAGCLVEAGGTTVDACQNANEVAKSSNGVGTTGGVSISDSQIFWLTAGYQLYPWMNLSLVWLTASPLRHPDNSLRQPFVSTDYNAFTQLSVGATFSFPGQTDD